MPRVVKFLGCDSSSPPETLAEIPTTVRLKSGFFRSRPSEILGIDESALVAKGLGKPLRRKDSKRL
jgi:hypothetical protein